jgi:iron complex transport system substrate-binding protein
MRRALFPLTFVAALALAACGGDDDDTASATTNPPTTTAAPTTSAASTTTEATATTTSADDGYVAGADPDADAAALAWTTAFDSTLGFDAKSGHIADADVLQPTIVAYTAAGDAVGGIALEPTKVEVSGDTAAITYDVTFAGQPAYQGQTGTVERVDGTWVVSRDEFCGFMAAARNPCPAG